MAESGLAIVQTMHEHGLLTDMKGRDFKRLRAVSQHSKQMCTTIACLITGKWFVAKIKAEHRVRLLECILCGWNPLEKEAQVTADRLDTEITQQFVQRFIGHLRRVWYRSDNEKEVFEGLCEALEQDMHYIPGTDQDGRLEDAEIEEMMDLVN